jgi:hypothetical protein
VAADISAELLQDLVVLGETPGLVLVPDPTTIDDDGELTALARA